LNFSENSEYIFINRPSLRINYVSDKIFLRINNLFFNIGQLILHDAESFDYALSYFNFYNDYVILNFISSYI